jgi:hypothetical protein
MAVQSRVSNLLHKQADAAADDDDEDDDAYKKPNESPVSEKYSIIVRLLRFPDKKTAQRDRLKRVFTDDNFCLVNIQANIVFADLGDCAF